ncbi:uncharacterized protein LOC124120494 [Haliotis rufescens]|uniref:uncharacterized protein LOC124120494 n=1 Tax=Haliotis rufescens TaxID=6454 RepID=UPI00201EC3DC|nr:uncharacterized protein LOC124120494 [Haliotis rufescens]XP_048256099.1 uncharacterized protein LOC124120494 [Haliotis rufescens]
MNSNSVDISPVSPIRKHDAVSISDYSISLPPPNTCKASSLPEVMLNNSCNITDDHDTCKMSFDRDDSMNHTPAASTDVPFNTPQDSCSDVILACRKAEIIDVLDEVSKTVTTLFCNEQNGIQSNSQSKCQEKTLVSVETGKETTEAEIKKLRSLETDPVLSISIDKLDEMYCEDISQCEMILSQCELSKECELIDESANIEKCVLQASPSLGHQIHFACKLDLMPTCDEGNQPCSPVRVKMEEMVSRNDTDFLKQVTDERVAFGRKSSVTGYVSENNCSDYSSDDPQDSEMDNYSLCENGAHEGKSVYQKNIYVSPDVSLNTSFTAGSEFGGKISDDHMIGAFDRHLIEDVKITIDNILEKCSKVCVMDYGNSHTSINQYEGEQCALGRNSLDVKTDNESEVTGLCSDCTLLAERLRADSCHTKPITINEANISHLKTISEPSADCQVPVAMPCHDNKHQGIRRSHENLAALVLHSSENSTHETEKCIQDSLEPKDPSMQYTQVSKNLSQTENSSSGVSLSPLRPTLEDSSSDEGQNLDNENLRQDEKILFGDVQLIKQDLISGNAQYDQGEMQVPEQSPLSSENLTDFHVGSALIEEGPTVHLPTPFEEVGLVPQNKDIYIGGNDLMEAYTNFNDLQNDNETGARNVEESHTWDESSKQKNIQFEIVHSHKDVNVLSLDSDENGFPSRSMTAVCPHILRDVSPLQNQSEDNIDLERSDVSTVETQRGNGYLTCSVEESVLCCSLPCSTEQVSSVPELGSTCFPRNHHIQETSTCSTYSRLMNNKGTNDPVSGETECFCTQQFTASVSQASIAEYLGDTTEDYGQAPIDQMPVPGEEGLSVADPGDDHTVPADLHLPTDESDVVMYEENTLQIKERECQQALVPTSPCFKWKYAPSANLDDISPGPKDSKQYDEDSLLTIYPLRTCRRPIRVGLSKRFRAKPLHEKLKP